MIEVHYFASIRESLGTAQESVNASPELTTVEALIDALIRQHGDRWEQVLRHEKVLMAVNQIVASANTVIGDGDEVAFFPPVSGG